MNNNSGFIIISIFNEKNKGYKVKMQNIIPSRENFCINYSFEIMTQI